MNGHRAKALRKEATLFRSAVNIMGDPNNQLSAHDAECMVKRDWKMKQKPKLRRKGPGIRRQSKARRGQIRNAIASEEGSGNDNGWDS